jgi:hypothetical protein
MTLPVTRQPGSAIMSSQKGATSRKLASNRVAIMGASWHLGAPRVAARVRRAWRAARTLAVDRLGSLLGRATARQMAEVVEDLNEIIAA